MPDFRVVAALMLFSVALGLGDQPAGGPRGTLVLDEAAYCRVYYEFGLDRMLAQELKANGEEILGKKGLAALARRVKGLCQERDIDWGKADWRDHAVVSFYMNNSTGAGVDPYRGRHVHADPPPDNWATPEFDDAVWPRLRRPLLVGEKATSGWQDASYLGVHRICYRTRFEVRDLRQVGELTLRLVYRGGARVLVNGQELTRGHLPPGPISPETLGQAYPLDAYAKRPDEIFPIERQWDERQRARKRAVYKYKFVPELFGGFENAARLKGKQVGMPEIKGYVPDLRQFGGRARALLSRNTWRRVEQARDRVLGPLTVPAKVLRQGSNLLAVEIVASPLHPATLVNWMRGLRGNSGWRHAQLKRMELRCSGGGAETTLRRPPEPEVWVEDVHHRVYSTEFLGRGFATGTVRIVAVRNGTFSGQVIVGTRGGLAGLKLTPGALRHENGKAVLPSSAMKVGYLVAHPLADLIRLDSTRTATRSTPLTAWEKMAMVGYAPAEAGGLSLTDRLEALEEVKFFDHITAAPVRRIEADTCQPIWLSLTVPAEAAPGTYRGELTIQAEGMKPATVPVEAEVIDWCAPDPRHFQTVSALEQSPYGVAKQYGAALWSEEHFRLLEASIKLLARAGNDWWFVPVLTHTELGNRQDSMIRWVRAGGANETGSDLAFDYAVLDRYLGLVVKHCGPPRVVSFLVMHGNPANPAEVVVYDGQTGSPEVLKLSYPEVPYEEYRGRWGEFATALNAHAKTAIAGAGGAAGPAWRLKQAMYWGYAWDTEGSPDLRVLLTEFVPDVYWSAGGHALRVDRQYYRATAQIFGRYSLVPRSQKGWKQERINVLNPRGGGNTHATAGSSLPFSYRLLADRSVAGGYAGFGRMGADYWKNSYYDGTRGGAVFLQPGMSLHALFWAGKLGAESSARYEMLLEGMLEAEARIFLEQAIDQGLLPKEMSERMTRLLAEKTRQTMYISINTRTQLDEYFPGWQDRSRRLFAAAAEAAGALGFDVDRKTIAADVPARGRTRLVLTLRSWTGKPRAWKAAGGAGWLRPEKTEGTAAGHEELPIILDAASLAPGQTAQGTLAVTDVQSGRTFDVQVTARVSAVFDSVFPTLNKREFGFLPDKGKVVFDLAPGESASRSVVFFNHAGVAVPWQAASSVPWVTVEPAAGRAPPECEFILNLTATPPKGKTGIHEGLLTVSEPGGTAKATTPVVTYALGPYRPPAALPTGQAVPLTADCHKRLLKSRKERHPIWAGHEVLWVGEGQANPMPADGTERGRKVANALIVPAPSRTVYNIEGQGFEAFSVLVDFPRKSAGYKYWAGRGRYPDWVRVRFEIYVDGRLRAHSGWMGPDDDLRALAVGDLAGTRQLALVTRHQRIPPAACSTGWWDARFYK